jgi:two-component system chemotaxis response regulator CheY
MALNILLVDDSITVRAVIAKTLQMAQIPIGTLYQAADGAEAMAVLDKEWIDLVFTDLHMPRMTGIELVERMAANNMTQTVPVVVVTSEKSRERIDQLLSRGVRAFVHKPFTPERLREVVTEVMGVVE